jgi:hypothetical protein
VSLNCGQWGAQPRRVRPCTCRPTRLADYGLICLQAKVANEFGPDLGLRPHMCTEFGRRAAPISAPAVKVQAFTSGSSIAFCTAAWSLVTMSGGVPCGADNPAYSVCAKFDTPASFANMQAIIESGDAGPRYGPIDGCGPRSVATAFRRAIAGAGPRYRCKYATASASSCT